MEISDALDAQINEGVKGSEPCKADAVWQVLRIGLAQFAARFQPPPLWLEERIRDALAEPAEATSPKQFNEAMGANKLRLHPAFYRRMRHYRDRLSGMITAASSRPFAPSIYPDI